MQLPMCKNLLPPIPLRGDHPQIKGNKPQRNPSASIRFHKNSSTISKVNYNIVYIHSIYLYIIYTWVTPKKNNSYFPSYWFLIGILTSNGLLESPHNWIVQSPIYLNNQFFFICIYVIIYVYMYIHYFQESNCKANCASTSWRSESRALNLRRSSFSKLGKPKAPERIFVQSIDIF